MIFGFYFQTGGSYTFGGSKNECLKHSLAEYHLSGFNVNILFIKSSA